MIQKAALFPKLQASRDSQAEQQTPIQDFFFLSLLCSFSLEPVSSPGDHIPNLLVHCCFMLSDDSAAEITWHILARISDTVRLFNNELHEKLGRLQQRTPTEVSTVTHGSESLAFPKPSVRRSQEPPRSERAESSPSGKKQGLFKETSPG